MTLYLPLRLLYVASALLFSLVACGPSTVPAKVQCLSPYGALLRSDHLPLGVSESEACAAFVSSEARALRELGAVMGHAEVQDALGAIDVYVREEYSWYAPTTDSEVRGLHVCHVFPVVWREVTVGTWNAFEDYVYAHEVAHAVRPCIATGHKDWSPLVVPICASRAPEYLGFDCDG